ncbi:MAG: sigma-70 family RNA polymerase sigma factor [Gammaproteobacteria bacterium]|nr:sigma-70 family RNA polymerase sigma factor [Gammaproteobacteria bacterium]
MSDSESGKRTAVAASAAASEVAEDDARLVGLALAGDQGAFEALYRRHIGRIYAHCLRLTSETTTAEECAQEAFIMAWRKLDSFRGDSAFGSWIYTIATNTVMMHFRQQKRQQNHLQSVDAEQWERLPGEAQSDGLHMDLNSALHSLPHGAKMVFLLHDVEGYRHEDIAEQLDIAVGTSKAQLHRARRLLRERLKQ